MPQFSSLSINDGSATPVAVAYAVEKLSSEQTVLVDRRQVSRELQPSLTVFFDRSTPQRKTFKVRHVIAMPLIRTVVGVVVATDIARASVEYTLPVSMTAQERADLNALVANSQTATVLKAGVKDLDPLY